MARFPHPFQALVNLQQALEATRLSDWFGGWLGLSDWLGDNANKFIQGAGVIDWEKATPGSKGLKDMLLDKGAAGGKGKPGRKDR